jgi:GNAT superfamily N-acetyltransferase
MPIRKAQIGEDEAIHSAHMRSIREVCVHDHGEDEIRGWGYRDCGERWRQSIADGLVWVVEHNGQIEGLACMAFKETHAYIHSLYLTPVVLGQGYGRRLMNIMLDLAKERGMHHVALESTLTAHDFYLRTGFVDSGPLRRVVIGGYPVTALPMIYTIS